MQRLQRDADETCTNPTCHDIDGIHEVDPETGLCSRCLAEVASSWVNALPIWDANGGNGGTPQDHRIADLVCWILREHGAAEIDDWLEDQREYAARLRREAAKGHAA